MTMDTDAGIGTQLHDMLNAHREFIRSTHALLRCIESEMTRRGWTLLRPSGYAVTGNGYSRGLASCADWIPTSVGVAFVRSNVDAQGGVTVTLLGEEPRHILTYQVRWLDAAGGEPAVWRVDLAVRRTGTGEKWLKWESWQQDVLTNLWRDGEPDADGSFAVKPGSRKDGGVTVEFDGTGQQVPVAALVDSEAVVRLLIEPALARAPAERIAGVAVTPVTVGTVPVATP